jgi:PPK2 family polyphosphate:nucleotide phosphotransferase
MSNTEAASPVDDHDDQLGIRQGHATYADRFRVRPGHDVRLEGIDPGFKGLHGPKKAAEQIDVDRQMLRALQELLYADGRCALLICLQGMDTAGKDGTIAHILGSMNPQGCEVIAFKQPSAVERSHDFLWRIHKATPARGRVAIFNRSQYEDVLVARVHNLVPREVWSLRYDQINQFEKELVDGDTQVLKFCLHISKEEQLHRFAQRLDDPAKQWKISEADYKERAFWGDYLTAYDAALSRCSTPHAPWFIVPSDHKWFRDLVIARIVVEHLQGLRLQRPKPTVDLARIRQEYHAAKR